MATRAPSASSNSVMFVSLRVSPRVARVIDVGLGALIILNVAAAILETVEEIGARGRTAFAVFDAVSVAIFSVEYALRIWLAPQHPSGRYTSPLRGRLRFAVSPMALVDLAAILPFYLSMVVRLDLRFLRALRLVRIFKLTRHSSAMTILLDVLRQEARSFYAALSILLVILILASSGIYLVEHDAQPEAFGSIPAAMWWAVATLTTVGYGDVTPITNWGKLFGALITIIGIGMVALPAGILSSAFSDSLRRRREAFQEQVSDAVEGGRLSQADLEALEQRGEELGLSEEEEQRVLGAAQTTARHDHDATSCPHCGGPLG